ncbi:OmpA family protein [Tenacibaculum sp. ZS6-P6]|uniref:OmpA family protein n=1 Tax=Tenacibaculum sp. ZS6-P6 TaxID=3447503 RepID=UPI003F9D92F3
MANINTFDQGAKILQNVDVTSMVAGLALGIANAQEQLDNNSVKQITKLAQTQVGGKSLLELGFRPAFYAFERAEISASISLKMAVKEELEIDFELEYDSTRKKGYTDEHIQKIENNYKEEKYREFKSSRKYWTTLSNEHTLKVNETTVNTSTKTGSIERVDETASKLSSDSKVERVDSEIIDTTDVVSTDNTNKIHVHNYKGYGMLSMLDYYTEDTGIVKINNYSGLSIKLSNALTINGSDLNSNLGSITNCVFKMGLKDGDKFDVYFAFSKHHPIDFAYSQGTAPNNTNQLKEKLKALAFIMMKDSDVKIRIVGHTDSVSGDNFNKDLGLKRATGVANYLKALGVNEAQITEIVSEGEAAAKTAVGDNKKDADYRKAVIEVNTSGNEYIYIEGDKTNVNSHFIQSEADAVITTWAASTTSGLIMSQAKLAASTNKKLKVESGSDVTIDQNVKTLSAINTQFENSNKFYSQVSGDVVYLLRKDAKIEYTLYSNDTEELVIEDKSTSTQNTQNSNDTLQIHKVINSKYFAKSDVTKIKDPKVSAWSGSLDFRYARQFGMSVEGNASVTASMISIPAPTEFENYVQSLTGNTSSN